ncbi:MAG: hypothetical protein FJ148_07800 [Deltaproteobacteria bacterium]|nr:hypothetical protein [Deltaproteobacteria bacterium]
MPHSCCGERGSGDDRPASGAGAAMNVAGIGIVFSRGRGLDALAAALREGWRAPTWRAVASLPGAEVPVHAVDDALLRDRAILGQMRRADRFTKMAVLAAADAVVDAGLAVAPGSTDVGIVVASGLGSHATAFRFLDEMLEFGEAAPSPTLFSRSVQNAAASHIALHLGAHGPTTTLTQFHLSFHQALLVASAWLSEGRCSHVLVGAAEECGAVMEYVCRERIRLAPDGRIEPLRFGAAPEAVPGEGSVFFVLARDRASRCYGTLEVAPAPSLDAADLVLVDSDGLTEDETPYRAVAGARAVAAYSPVYGSMMTGTAFHCAAALLMLRDRLRFAVPVTENPHRLTVPLLPEPSDPVRIECIRHGCGEQVGSVRISR